MMSKSKIFQNGIYHDGKRGIRRVISLNNSEDIHAAPRVQYQILSAKNEKSFRYALNQSVPVVGTTKICELASFVASAEVILSEGECTDLLLNFKAQKVKLSPGEHMMMQMIADEYVSSTEPPVAGTAISFSFNDIRQARGLEKKGMVTVDTECKQAMSGEEIILTNLGAIRLSLLIQGCKHGQ